MTRLQFRCGYLLFTDRDKPGVLIDGKVVFLPVAQIKPGDIVTGKGKVLSIEQAEERAA